MKNDKISHKLNKFDVTVMLSSDNLMNKGLKGI